MVRYQILSLIPKNLQSYLVGSLSRINWPQSLAPTVNKALASYLKIDLSDSEKNLEDFRSFEELFTRSLKENARVMHGPMLSPCDSMLRQSLPVEKGQLIQAKALDYTVEDLLCLSEIEKKEFNPKWYCSFYLAPHNYHRVHSPFKARVLSARYLPGELWPVNDLFANYVPKLFCRNERVVFELEHPEGGKAFLVMVGALHVGRIQIKGVNTFVSNDLSRQLHPGKTRAFTFSPAREVKEGEELGTFMLGSTVILVFDEILAQKYSFRTVRNPEAIQLGQSLLIQSGDESSNSLNEDR